MTPEKWIDEQIREKGMKKNFIVRRIKLRGFTSQKLSAICSGRRKIKVEEFISICAVLGISPFDYPLQTVEGVSECAGA